MPAAKRTKRANAAPLKTYQSKRNFDTTAEPRGNPSTASRGKHSRALAFVIQKHAATNLHFDLRLELDGVMKSWAVPKGPNMDPSVKRLAMEVEDHPMEYNKFEGTIPQGEYGGGTVMVWDRGTYTPHDIDAGETAEDAVRRSLDAGKLAFTFHGEKMHGSFALVRTRRGEEKPQWLLIKHHDEYAATSPDIVETEMMSVVTGRTMEEIAAADSSTLDALEHEGMIEPMQAKRARLPLPVGEYAVEPLYHGVRAVAFVTNGTAMLVESSPKRKNKRNSESLLEEAPELTQALHRLARNHDGALVLDGVFIPGSTPSFVAFDVLVEGDDVLTEEPWIERRRHLDEALKGTVHKNGTGPLQTSAWVASDVDALKSAVRSVGRGDVVAKRIDSPYESGASKYWFRSHV